jgi:hypothetical protein
VNEHISPALFQVISDTENIENIENHINEPRSKTHQLSPGSRRMQCRLALARNTCLQFRICSNLGTVVNTTHERKGEVKTNNVIDST